MNAGSILTDWHNKSPVKVVTQFWANNIICLSKDTFMYVSDICINLNKGSFQVENLDILAAVYMIFAAVK